jgi:hypothetical protein
VTPPLLDGVHPVKRSERARLRVRKATVASGDVLMGKL